MTKAHLGILIALICGGAIVGTVIATKPKTFNKPTTLEKNTSRTYSMDMVASHAASDDCWTVIGGKVYDITPYVKSHPGGTEILRSCGKDGTSLFTTRRTAEGEEVGSGTPHSSSAQKALEQFEIGTLAQ